MAKITWTNKVTIDPRPDIPAANKLTADDINEVKTSVNAAYDEIEALETDHASLESDFVDHKTNTANPHNVTAEQLPDLQAKIDATTDPIISDVADLDTNKVDKEANKRLMTDAEGTKLQGIETGAQVNTVDPIDLADLAADYNGKLADKVDKVTGQRLMSDAEGTKLAGIEAGAQVNTVSPSDLTDLETALNSTIDADVAAEATIREGADVVLQENIDAEATARDAADVALQADIDTRLPIDGIASVDLPTTPSVGDWYTVAEITAKRMSVGDFEFLSTGSGEHNIVNFHAGASFHTNAFLNIYAKTTYYEGIDLLGIRILLHNTSLGGGAKLQLQFHDAQVNNGELTLKDYSGVAAEAWNLVEPVIENTVTDYTVACEISILGDTDTHQTGDHHVQGNKRVLNTDDAATFEPVIATKNTAFNKNFGTTAGTVREGNNPFSYSQITGKPSTFTPDPDSTFTNIVDTPVDIETDLDLEVGNIFTAQSTGVTPISIVNPTAKRATLIVESLGNTSQVTFSGTNVYWDSPANDGGLNYPPNIYFIFNIVCDGTRTFISRIGTYAQ